MTVAGSWVVAFCDEDPRVRMSVPARIDRLRVSPAMACVPVLLCAARGERGIFITRIITLRAQHPAISPRGTRLETQLLSTLYNTNTHTFVSPMAQDSRPMSPRSRRPEVADFPSSASLLGPATPPSLERSPAAPLLLQLRDGREHMLRARVGAVLIARRVALGRAHLGEDGQ